MKVIDSHVHLYTKENALDLSWMTPESPLCGDHQVVQYAETVKNSAYKVEGLVFIEVDVKYSTDWRYAVKEYGYVVDQFQSAKEFKVFGLIPWAPLNEGVGSLTQFVEKLKVCKGEFAFQKYCKGFRYLVQDKPSGTMIKRPFIESLNWLSDNGFVFDLGIDLRCGGLWQFEEAIEMCKQTRCRLIMNHLTKPDYYNMDIDQDRFDKWKHFMSEIKQHSDSYIKVSGGFSELSPALSARIKAGKFEVDEVVDLINPWFETCLNLWGPERMIWGSDYPVCTINGGEVAVARWIEITEKLFDRHGFTPEQKQAIYYDNVLKAYNL
ncbi:hypothetical protein LJB42_000945 [Komagataella kurtzmanii]|nr:hypothetical protein LJB42_000945 [Komagataella kurtzmanii]